MWLLLKHGADRDGRNKDGKRAIDCCAKESDVYNLLAANFLADVSISKMTVQGSIASLNSGTSVYWLLQSLFRSVLR